MTRDPTPTEPQPRATAISGDPQRTDELAEALEGSDDIVPPLDAPFDIPDVDLIEQRRTAALDEEAWQHD